MRRAEFIEGEEVEAKEVSQQRSLEVGVRQSGGCDDRGSRVSYLAADSVRGSGTLAGLAMKLAVSRNAGAFRRKPLSRLIVTTRKRLNSTHCGLSHRDQGFCG